MYPLRPAQAAALGDISHLLKCWEKKKNSPTILSALPALSCDSSETDTLPY